MNVIQREPKTASRSLASVRRRIAVLFLLGALVTAGVLAALLVRLRSDEIASANKLLTAVAQLVDEQTSRTLQNVDQVLQNAAATLSAASPSAVAGGVDTRAASIDAQLHKLVEDRPYLTVIRVLDARGRAIYGSDTGNTGLDLSDRTYFTERRDNRATKSLFSAPTRSRSSGKWVIPAARTVRAANGDFAGVIVAGVDPLFFNRVWTIDEAIPELTMTLFRADSVMLMRTPVDAQLIGKSFPNSQVFERMRAGIHVGNYENESLIDGKVRLFAFRRLTAYPGLVLVAGQGLDQALADWWHIVRIVVSGWVVGTMAVGVLTIWLAREWNRRRATEDRYRLLFQSNPYPVVVIDRDTRHFLAVNDATVEQYGWSREEFLTMTANDLYLPEDVPEANAMRQDGAWGVTPAVQGLRHRRKNGTVFDVETTVRPIDLEGRPAVLALAHDVTARHTAEAQLRQSQKMEAVGQLTGGIAHDFNNILMVILANADQLQEEETPDAAMVAARLEPITQAVMRASALTRQLLAFSRKQPLNPKRTALNDLVSDTGKLLHRALGEQIEIDSALADGLWTVNIDRTQLETALVNLCVNARDAMPGGGKLLIETRNVSLDKDNVTQANDVAPGDYVMLSVTDTGSGMPPETRAKVFEPFFTTKEVGKGTGLGLSMVYGFIKQSNGHITIHSEVGRGTTFRLYFPRSDGVQEETAVRQTAPLPRGTERVLVIEDELQVRAGVVQQLQSLGYVVSQAPDGAAGVASFEVAPQPYDLLLTDVVMPGRLSGKALADEVVRRWPKTRIVFMSGYAENAVLNDGMPDAGVRLLSKPFRKSDLAKILRQALDDAPGSDHTPPKAA
jgi:PAS domain S-box-containing protein